ncbi:unnamed protein product [Trifolium pratense]|nr:unnamed protein product [Trifolium pratense]
MQAEHVTDSGLIRVGALLNATVAEPDAAQTYSTAVNRNIPTPLRHI